MMKNKIISYSHPKSVVSEVYRTLRTNLEFSLAGKDMKTILITSSHAGEGKSVTSLNLATVFAMQGKRTVLVDSDMRKGNQHRNFDISNLNGLSNYLSGLDFYDKHLIKETEIPNLYFINCGPVPPNPAELISLDKMKTLLQYLKENYDIVIVDGVPILPVTDSLILASIVDKVVIVTSHSEAHKDELKAVKNALDNVNANIAGVVFNKVNMKSGSYGKYGKYYGKYYGSEEEKTRTK